MDRKKIAYLVLSIPSARNTTPYQRIKSLSETFELYLFTNNDSLPDEFRNKVNFCVNPFKNFPGNSYLFMLWSIWQLIKKRKEIDLIMTSFNPSTLIPGIILKKFLNIKWVADIYDMPNLQTETLSGRGLVKTIKSMLLKFQYFIVKKILKNANLVFCTLHPDALSEYDIPKNKVIELTNGVDLTLIENFFKTQIINKEKERFFRILYVGFVLKIRGIDIIIKAANLLKEKYPLIKWELIGPSNKYDVQWFKEKVKRNNLEKTVIWYGKKKHEEVLKHIAKADICLFTFPKTFATEYIYPIKIFEYMAFGKAIIATKLKGVSSILRDKKHALLIEPDNYIQLAQAVETLYKDPDLKRLLGKNAKKEVYKYDWTNINHEIINKLNSLIGGRK